ncbi:MAG: T9SS type A sorting domain-containing protein [Flavobacteriales bacterium]|nr:T9SS type A sorting domain-containing protein [Flavobacteriales bacterium]
MMMLVIIATAFPGIGLAQAGAIDPSFNPIDIGNNNGDGAQNTTCAVLQPDGKVVIAGLFNQYNGMDRARIARTLPDGTIDLSFDPGTGFNSNVNKVILQSDGKIIAVGDFTSFNGTPCGRIARLNTNGTLDPSFSTGTGFAYTVYDVALQTDGRIIAVGNFWDFNGVARKNIARLNTDGTLDPSLAPGTGFNYYVNAVAIQADGKIIAAGDFGSFNGTPLNRIARLNADGTLDGSFSIGTGFNASVYGLTIQPDGSVLVGGGFTVYNGTTRNGIARLSTNGVLDGSFNPGTGVNGAVYKMVLRPDGRVLIGGGYTIYNGTPRSSIAQILANATLDPSFDPGIGTNSGVGYMLLQPDGRAVIGDINTEYDGHPMRGPCRILANGNFDPSYNSGTGANGTVKAMARQVDGRILIGGQFTKWNGTVRRRLARLNADGTLDPSFGAMNGLSSSNDEVGAIAVLPSGRILVAGQFNAYDGTSVGGIVRLMPDGTLDPTFNPGGTGFDSYDVRCFALQPDGRILVGGYFFNYNGSNAPRIVRLNADGSYDPTFLPGTGPNGHVIAMVLQPDGRIIAGGCFNTVNAIPSNFICRLNADGSLDPSFVVGSGFNSCVYALDPVGNGQVIAGGFFDTYNGSACPRIARLNANGTNDITYNVGSGFTGGAVNALLKQSDGKLFAAGNFTAFNGIPQARLARLRTDGILDTEFDPGTGFPTQAVNALALQPDYKLLAAGSFTSYNGTGRNRVARIFTGIPCTQTVTIEMGTDGGGLRWAFHDAGTAAVVASSPGYPAYEYPTASPDYAETTCLPDGEFYFVFEDEDCDGIVNGGYIVRVGGKRVIDNRNNLNNGCPSAIAGNTGVNVPVGNDRLISQSCDRMELRRGVNASCSDRLTADNTPNGTSGNVYQFWIYEPNGGLSIRYPANGPGSNQVSMAALPSLAEGTMYNVRVRTRIAPGQWRAWGSACRMRIDNTLGQCGAAALVDDLSNANHSCGKSITLPAGNSSGAANRVVCMPVTRYNNNCVNVQANKYQFRFRIPAENVVIVRNSNTNFTHMHTSDGFAECKTYEVEVRASFNSGSTWCRGGVDPVDDLTPWGKVCEVYTGGCDEEFVGNHHMLGAGQSEQSEGLKIYPNPNRGDQLFLSVDAIAEGVNTVSVDIYDTFGKHVSARTIAVQSLGSGSGGFINTVLELNGELATGLYMVHITAGDAVYTERLVIQP